MQQPLVFNRPRKRKPFDSQELMAVVLSRALRNGEFVGTGAGSAFARAACRLAQRTHAPDLTYFAGGSGALNSYLEPLEASSCDYANLVADAVTPVADLIGAVTGGHIDVFVGGGMQIDQYGNANLSAIGDYDHPKLRGPGAALLSSFWAARRGIILFTLDHTPRTFVERVAFRTMPGFLDGAEDFAAAQASGAYSGGGPLLCLTPLALFDFAPDSRRMRLVSVHPGLTVEQVRTATGFPLLLPDGAQTDADVPTTPTPDPTAIALLREMDEYDILADPV